MVIVCSHLDFDGPLQYLADKTFFKICLPCVFYRFNMYFAPPLSGGHRRGKPSMCRRPQPSGAGT